MTDTNVTDAPDTTSAEPAADQADAPSTATGNDALQAEVDRWKHQARENEKRAKANAAAAKELEEFRKTQMTETERAIDEARNAARSEVLTEVGSKLARAEIRAALTGVVSDPASVIDDLDLARFVKDGEPDAKAIEALVAKWAKLVPPSSPPKVPTGARGAESGPATFTRAQLRDSEFFAKHQAEIMRAMRDGRIVD